MEKAGNQTIQVQQLSKGNVQQLKKLVLSEEKKRENVMGTGRNGRNQLLINVRNGERGIKVIQFATLYSSYDDTTMW